MEADKIFVNALFFISIFSLGCFLLHWVLIAISVQYQVFAEGIAENIDKKIAYADKKREEKYKRLTKQRKENEKFKK